jgi:cyclopropane-fatty-acyl-phospholipid synthase
MQFTPGEKGATLQHYDDDPRIFRLFLDPRLKYSPGLYTGEDDTMAAAVERKLAWVVDKLRLHESSCLLDIGCGWGALAGFAAERTGCSVVAITPSKNQADFIRARMIETGAADRVHVLQTHVQDANLEPRSFDAVCLMGSIIHMDDKAAIVERAYRALRKDGRIYLSEVCSKSEALWRKFEGGADTRFLMKDVFGWASVVPLSRYIEHLENAGFSVEGVWDFTGHYRRAISDWKKNVEKNREALEAIRTGVADHLLRYFDTANAAWGYTVKQYSIVGAKVR